MQFPANLRLAPLANAAAFVALGTLAVASVAACGSGGSDSPADAASDAPPAARVQKVNCPATVDVEIIEIVKPNNAGYDYSPNPATIRAGGIARFKASDIHSTRSREAGLFAIDFQQTECFKFNTKETHQFYCTAHGFQGSIIVQ